MERRLAAILAADVAGYSRLMGQDEAGTLSALTRLRKDVIEPLIATHRGRVVKLMGDGFLVEFQSVVDAVNCAVAWQRDVEAGTQGQPFRFRIGVNLGDVIVEEGDIHGDGVNVAARLQEIAEPGGICLSGTVFEHIGTRVDIALQERGEQHLKNIAKPIRVYAMQAARSDSAAGIRPPGPPALPDKPSIAILPFQNMSGDPEQEYFADGMVEEIITALSRMRWLFVIARNSSFTYKGLAVDVKQVGRELGVRYVLEGSVRKAAARVRITGQLIDTLTGAHLWADRFEGALEDIFDLQDQVTASVVGAIMPRLEQAEIERAKRKPTESLDAYDLYLRGMSGFHLWNREGNNEALSLFQRAIDIDPNFASAYGMAARAYSQRKAMGWMTDRAREIAETAQLARRAGEVGKDDAVALSAAGLALAFVVGDLDDGAALTDRALALNPNLAVAWLSSGWVNVWLGEPEVSIERFARAMRLSPQDPQFFNMQAGTGAAHFIAGRPVEALAWAASALRDQPHLLSACTVAASSALTGRPAEAERAMSSLRQLYPDLHLSNLTDLFPIRRLEHFALWKEALRKAGLPE